MRTGLPLLLLTFTVVSLACSDGGSAPKRLQAGEFKYSGTAFGETVSETGTDATLVWSSEGFGGVSFHWISLYRASPTLMPQPGTYEISEAHVWRSYYEGAGQYSVPGTITIDAVNATHARGRFSLRSSAVNLSGEFHAVLPSP